MNRPNEVFPHKGGGGGAYATRQSRTSVEPGDHVRLPGTPSHPPIYGVVRSVDDDSGVRQYTLSLDNGKTIHRGADAFTFFGRPTAPFNREAR